MAKRNVIIQGFETVQVTERSEDGVVRSISTTSLEIAYKSSENKGVTQIRRYKSTGLYRGRDALSPSPEVALQEREILTEKNFSPIKLNHSDEANMEIARIANKFKKMGLSGKKKQIKVEDQDDKELVNLHQDKPEKKVTVPQNEPEQKLLRNATPSSHLHKEGPQIVVSRFSVVTPNSVGKKLPSLQINDITPASIDTKFNEKFHPSDFGIDFLDDEFEDLSSVYNDYSQSISESETEDYDSDSFSDDDDELLEFTSPNQLRPIRVGSRSTNRSSGKSRSRSRSNSKSPIPVNVSSLKLRSNSATSRYDSSQNGNDFNFSSTSRSADTSPTNSTGLVSSVSDPNLTRYNASNSNYVRPKASYAISPVNNITELSARSPSPKQGNNADFSPYLRNESESSEESSNQGIEFIEKQEDSVLPLFTSNSFLSHPAPTQNSAVFCASKEREYHQNQFNRNLNEISNLLSSKETSFFHYQLNGTVSPAPRYGNNSKSNITDPFSEYTTSYTLSSRLNQNKESLQNTTPITTQNSNSRFENHTDVTMTNTTLHLPTDFINSPEWWDQNRNLKHSRNQNPNNNTHFIPISEEENYNDDSMSNGMTLSGFNPFNNLPPHLSNNQESHNYSRNIQNLSQNNQNQNYQNINNQERQNQNQNWNQKQNQHQSLYQNSQNQNQNTYHNQDQNQNSNLLQINQNSNFTRLSSERKTRSADDTYSLFSNSSFFSPARKNLPQISVRTAPDVDSENSSFEDQNETSIQHTRRKSTEDDPLRDISSSLIPTQKKPKKIKHHVRRKSADDQPDRNSDFDDRNELVESPNSKLMFKNFTKYFKIHEKEGGLKTATKYVADNLNDFGEKIRWKIFLELADLAKRENKLTKSRLFFELSHNLQPYASQLRVNMTIMDDNFFLQQNKAWLEHAKMEEECGELKNCKKLINEGLRYCILNENLMIKALKYEERVQNLPKVRQLLSQLKNCGIEKCWRMILEGALIEARAGNITVSRKIFKFLMKNVPWYGPIYQEAYKIEEKNENYAKSLSIINQGLLANPRYGPLWFGALTIYEKINDTNKNVYGVNYNSEPILELIRNIAERAKQSISKELSWKVYFEVAQIEDRCNQLEKSRNAYVQSVNHCPQNLLWKVWLAGARTELFQGNIEISRKLLQRSLSEVPHKMRSTVLLECSRLEEFAGDLEKSRQILKEAREESRHQWKVFLESVLLEIRAQNIQGAILQAKEALCVHKGTGRLWAVLIQLKQSKSIQSQKKAFKKALKEVPKSGEVWCEGARIALLENDLVEARNYLKFAIQFTPQYGDSFIEYLRLEVMENSDERSIQRLEQLCVNADPNYGVMWLHCKKNPLDSTRRVFGAARDSITEILNLENNSEGTLNHDLGMLQLNPDFSKKLNLPAYEKWKILFGSDPIKS